MIHELAQASHSIVEVIHAAEGICVTEDVRISEDFKVSDDDRHRAYAQWVSIEIINHGPRPVKIKNVYTSWGKLYIDGNKDKEVKPSHFENTTINPKGSLTIAGCGRANASSGTEGGFNIVDPNRGDDIIRTVYWDCPWGSKTNKWSVSGSLSGWEVYHKGANINSGALGNITMETVYKG